MVAITLATTFALTLASVSAAPLRLEKRIAQVIVESTANWEQACLAAGGGQQCNPLSIQAFSTLLAAPGPCAQQDAADNMIDLAKQLNNDAEMIRLTQIFRQQPRNAPDSLSVLYCQTAARNAELQGLFQCQFQGVNDNVFTGGVALGQAGTIPFGLNGPLSPPGSCPASPGGKVPDGVQLNTLVSNPGSAGNVSTGGGNASDDEPADSGNDNVGDGRNNANDGNNNNNNNNNNTPPANTGGATGGQPFTLQNGLDAQRLNAQFATISASDSCNAGDQACVDGGFAQCVGGSWVVTPCAGGLQCFALPLVNKAGTSITCDTEADAADRIARTGATGGIAANGGSAGAGNGNAGGNNNTNNNNNANNNNNNVNNNVNNTPAPASGAAAGGQQSFTLQNGLDAQRLNAQFATMSAGDSCNAGDQACVDGGFAQCVGGSWVVTPCAGGLQCFALPLVNKAGTSITCDTEADAADRIARTGATGGITGN